MTEPIFNAFEGIDVKSQRRSPPTRAPSSPGPLASRPAQTSQPDPIQATLQSRTPTPVPTPSAPRPLTPGSAKPRPTAQIHTSATSPRKAPRIHVPSPRLDEGWLGIACAVFAASPLFYLTWVSLLYRIWPSEWRGATNGFLRSPFTISKAIPLVFWTLAALTALALTVLVGRMLIQGRPRARALLKRLSGCIVLTIIVGLGLTIFLHSGFPWYSNLLFPTLVFIAVANSLIYTVMFRSSCAKQFSRVSPS